MEHRLAQRRMLICAAFFSFGTCSGAMTSLRLSETATDRCFSVVSAFFSTQPMLRLPAALILVLLTLMLCGSDIIGACALCMLLTVFGFGGGLIICMAFRTGNCSPISFAFFALFAVCLLQMGSGLLHFASAAGKHYHCKPVKPDFSYDISRVACAAAVLMLSSLAFAYYLLNS